MISLSRRHLVSYLIASFFAGIAASVAVPLLASRAGDLFWPSEDKEIVRVTSPDGRVDAVMIRDNCGAPCYFGYSVFIVPRGMNPSKGSKGTIFYADDMADEKLTWKQPHLLSIGYSRALIYSFRNVSYPLHEFGKEETWLYKVEIQLAPTSTGFSYLESRDL